MKDQLVNLNEQIDHVDKQIDTTRKNLEEWMTKKYTPDAENHSTALTEIETKRKTLAEAAKEPLKTLAQLSSDLNGIQQQIVSQNLPQNQISIVLQEFKKKMEEAAKQLTSVLKMEVDLSSSVALRDKDLRQAMIGNQLSPLEPPKKNVF